MEWRQIHKAEIWIAAQANLLTDMQFARWLPYVGEKKAAQLQKMRQSKAKESLVGLLLAKYAIYRRWGLPFSAVQFGVGTHGKPYALGQEQVHFNVSHSGGVCVCAVDDEPIGVDIQEMKPCRFDAIAERFFTPLEQRLYHEQGGDKLAFYRMWTKRESVGKYLSTGFFYAAEQDTADWRTVHMLHREKYMICVCKRNKIY